MNILTILQILLKDLRKKSKKQTCFQFWDLKTGLFLYCFAAQVRETAYSAFVYKAEFCKRSDMGSVLTLILNTKKIKEKICAEIAYIRDCRLDFF